MFIHVKITRKQSWNYLWDGEARDAGKAEKISSKKSRFCPCEKLGWQGKL